MTVVGVVGGTFEVVPAGIDAGYDGAREIFTAESEHAHDDPVRKYFMDSGYYMTYPGQAFTYIAYAETLGGHGKAIGGLTPAPVCHAIRNVGNSPWLKTPMSFASSVAQLGYEGYVANEFYQGRGEVRDVIFISYLRKAEFERLSSSFGRGFPARQSRADMAYSSRRDKYGKLLEHRKDVGFADEWASKSSDIRIFKSKLPGSEGLQVSRRLSMKEMEHISKAFGREFGLVYDVGPGRHGGGGTYTLFSGGYRNVPVPTQAGRFWIYHTHTSGLTNASGTRNSVGDLIRGDQFILEKFQQKFGSPQKTSVIIPVSGTPFRFSVDQKHIPITQ